MSACEELLENPDPQHHLVQLYEANQQVLVDNVTCYLSEGLKRGSALLVIATAQHRELFLRGLKRVGADPETAIRESRFVMLDAEEMLGRFMVEGYPDSERFDAIIGTMVRDAVARTKTGDLRAYGEMVGVLWKTRQFPAAIRTEQLWNKLQRSISFTLFCAYPIDVFDKHFDVGVVDALLCAHTHLLPSATNGDLEAAIHRAMAEVLGSAARELRPTTNGGYRAAWAAMPRAEAVILWLRHDLPDRADEILARARRYYQVAS
jgi:hypothetical protein